MIQGLYPRGRSGTWRPFAQLTWSWNTTQHLQEDYRTNSGRSRGRVDRPKGGKADGPFSWETDEGSMNLRGRITLLLIRGIIWPPVCPKSFISACQWLSWSDWCPLALGQSVKPDLQEVPLPFQASVSLLIYADRFLSIPKFLAVNKCRINGDTGEVLGQILKGWLLVFAQLVVVTLGSRHFSDPCFLN